MAEAERWRRDRQIMRLAGRGWTDREISERVGLHPKSISRIIRREIRRAS